MTEVESDILAKLNSPYRDDDHSPSCFGRVELANLEQSRCSVRRCIADPAKLDLFAGILAEIIVKHGDPRSTSVGVQRAAALIPPNTWKEFRYAVMWKIIDAEGKKIGDIPNIRDIKETSYTSLPIHNDEIYNKYTIEAEQVTRGKKDKI